MHLFEEFYLEILQNEYNMTKFRLGATMSNTPNTEQDYFQQSKELTNEQEKEGQTLYDPYKNAPLSMNERLYFNISIVYVTLISSFVFALVMVARPSFSVLFRFGMGNARSFSFNWF